jgi:hypothetical protein
MQIGALKLAEGDAYRYARQMAPPSGGSGGVDKRGNYVNVEPKKSLTPRSSPQVRLLFAGDGWQSKCDNPFA